jgi:hypothetical protein
MEGIGIINLKDNFMDVLKILGAKDSSGTVPVNVKVAIDPTVTQAVRIVAKSFVVGMFFIGAGIAVSSIAKNRRR